MECKNCKGKESYFINFTISISTSPKSLWFCCVECATNYLTGIENGDIEWDS